MEMHNNVRDFRQLKVWQMSISLMNEIYKVTSKFPVEEKYSLTSQLLRATQSISGNIAEGNSQLYVKKEINFLNTAIGSAAECRNWLILAYNTGYITNADLNSLDKQYESIIKMLFTMIKRIMNS